MEKAEADFEKDKQDFEKRQLPVKPPTDDRLNLARAKAIALTLKLRLLNEGFPHKMVAETR